MKWFKIFGILAIASMLALPAWAGNIPEFDAVYCDADNLFAKTNLTQHFQVIHRNVGPFGPINFYSIFPLQYINTGFLWGEQFVTNAGQLFPDPCFDYLGMPCFEGEGYYSALTDAWNEGEYEWWIILQMKPESDINLNIKDCVLKHNEFDPYGIPGFPETASAEQTGRYRAPWGQLMFVPSANPSISAAAYPGPYATPGFTEPFSMDARRLPGLRLVSLDNVLYTSKAIWEEGIVMALPATGESNVAGDTTFNLKQGDQIRVKVTVPFNNTVDLRYGKDNVMLKYIGIVGTWYYGQSCQYGSDTP